MVRQRGTDVGRHMARVTTMWIAVLACALPAWAQGDLDAELAAALVSPLRNVAMQPAYFHNGAFTRLDEALVFHLYSLGSAPIYDPVAAGVALDLRATRGPIVPVLIRLDPLLQPPRRLTAAQFADLVEFVRDGLLDPGANSQALCALVPAAVPSGRPMLDFSGCAPYR